MATPMAASTQCNRVMIVVESPTEVQVDYQGLLCCINQKCQSFTVAVKGIKVDYFGYVPLYLSSDCVSDTRPAESIIQPALNYTVYYQMAGADSPSSDIPPDVKNVVGCASQFLSSNLPGVHIYNCPTAVPLQTTPQS